ncbi:hypothetical protein [Streptococcus oricebi]|uniref:LXG domain-containing protein n=1 Tax=Streptococcus oricebi TaxID=1547447 RepID=A0ABS5B474_9STRE|nr:hypothetical protein [Streptococcus oricebi]MBP2623638.1 hypothetical protein [Streptococcus oricebi]
MVKLNLVLSTVQAHTTASNCQGQLAAYQAIQQAIQTFVADSENLKGQAYDSARAYYSAVLLPISQGAELYVETAETSMKNLPSECTAKCGAFLLDTEEVERLIQAQEASISALELQYDGLRASSVPMEAKKSNLAYMAKQVEIHQGIKKDLEEQLQKLFDFDAYSPQIFSEADALKADLEKGLSQTENSWDASSQSFIISEDLAWARHLSTLHSLKDTNYTVQEKEFIYNLQEQYGFDKEESEIMLKAYNSMVDKVGTKEANKNWTLIMSSIVYGGPTWWYTNGALNESEISTVLWLLGLNQQEVRKLESAIINQHKLAAIEKISDNESAESKQQKLDKVANILYGTKDKIVTFSELTKDKQNRAQDLLKQFGNTIDFSHMNATIATYFNQSPAEDVADVLLGGLNERSGYLGDVAGANGAVPSMGNDDYRADLDAVNLYQRCKHGASLINSYNSYYNDVESDSTYRTKEFVKNIGGWTKLQEDYRKYDENTRPELIKQSQQKINEGNALLEKGKKLNDSNYINEGKQIIAEGKELDNLQRTFDNFIVNLIKGNKDLVDYTGK